MRQALTSMHSTCLLTLQLLAKEVKNLRKQLEEQRQHAAEQEAALAAAEAAVPATDAVASSADSARLHVAEAHGAMQGPEQQQTAVPETATLSDAGVQTATLLAASEVDARVRPKMTEASSQTETLAESASNTSQSTRPMAEMLTGSSESSHTESNAKPASVVTEAEQQLAGLHTGSGNNPPEPAGAIDPLALQPGLDLLTGPDQPSQSEASTEPAGVRPRVAQPMLDLLTGSAEALVGASSGMPQPSEASDLLSLDGLDVEAQPDAQLLEGAQGPSAAVHGAPAKSHTTAAPLISAEPSSAQAAAAATEPNAQPGAPAAASTSDPFSNMSLATLHIVPPQSDVAVQSATDVKQSRASQADPGPHQVPESNQSHALQRSANGPQAEPGSSAASASVHSSQVQQQSPRPQTDPGMPTSAAAYRRLLQEVSALRQRLHECSAEAIEGDHCLVINPL